MVVWAELLVGEGRTKRYKEILGVMNMLVTLIVVIVSWVYTYIKTHHVIHLKYEHFGVSPK